MGISVLYVAMLVIVQLMVRYHVVSAEWCDDTDHNGNTGHSKTVGYDKDVPLAWYCWKRNGDWYWLHLNAVSRGSGCKENDYLMCRCNCNNGNGCIGLDCLKNHEQ